MIVQLICEQSDVHSISNSVSSDLKALYKSVIIIIIINNRTQFDWSNYLRPSLVNGDGSAATNT